MFDTPTGKCIFTHLRSHTHAIVDVDVVGVVDDDDGDVGTHTHVTAVRSVFRLQHVQDCPYF